MSEPIEEPGGNAPGEPDRRTSGARVWIRDERFRLLMGRMTPGGLMVAGAGIAWQRPDLTGWLITGGLGLAGAGLEAWRTWLAYQYASAELRYADQAQQRMVTLEGQRLELGDRHDARQHELNVLAHTMHDAHRTARLEKVSSGQVTELARIEEVEDLWSTPVPERSASLTIDLRQSPPMDMGAEPVEEVTAQVLPGAAVSLPSPRRPRGGDRYRATGP